MAQVRYEQNCVDPFRSPLGPEVTGAKTTVRTREWDTDKLSAYLPAGLATALAGTLPDTDVRVMIARRPEIRFEGWKPAKMEELRETIGELMGEVMADLDPEDYLHV